MKSRSRCGGLTRGALYQDANATLDDLSEAVTTLEDTARIVRRVFGGAHPGTIEIEGDLKAARKTRCVRVELHAGNCAAEQEHEAVRRDGGPTPPRSRREHHPWRLWLSGGRLVRPVP